MIKDTRLSWRKSSYSGGDNGDCVELANTLDGVRDSKNPGGPILEADLASFLTYVKSGHLDH